MQQHQASHFGHTSVMGFLGFWGLGFIELRGLGLRVLGFRVLGFRVLGFKGFKGLGGRV